VSKCLHAETWTREEPGPGRERLIVDHLVKHNQLARRAMWQLDRAREKHSVRKLKAALRAFENVVEVMSPVHPDRPACLGNLAAAYRLLYEWTRDTTVIDDLVRVNGLIVESLPEQRAERVLYRRDLRPLVVDIIMNTRQAGLLSRLVPLAREAAIDPAGRPAFLEALGACLDEAFQMTEDPDVLVELVALERERVASMPADDPDVGAWLSDLGANLRSLALLSDEPEMLEEAVGIGRRAVDTCQPGHGDRAACLCSLGNSLHALFIQRDRSPATLHESVAMGRQAVALAPDDHAHRSACLTSLGIALRTLYEETRDLDALHEAVRVSREAVAKAGPDKIMRAKYLANLSAADQELFKRTGDGEVILEAVAASREAVDLSLPGTPQHAGRLSDLSNALHILSQGYGAVHVAAAAREPEDATILREAVRVAKAAVKAGPLSDRECGGRLSNLSVIARTLFERAGDAAALDEAVRAGRDAVAATSAGTAMREWALLSLVRALAQCPAEPNTLREIRQYCDELAAETIVPRTRVLAHLFLGRAAMSAEKPQAETALAAYEYAIAQLPEIAPRRLLRPDREHGLGELAGLPAEAASAALSLDRPEHALMLLEHSRGLLLRESMGSHGDLSELHRVDPAVAEEFSRLRDLLDALDQTSVDLYHGSPAPVSYGDRTRRHRELAEQWERLLGRIRQLPGLQDFLLPTAIESLRPLPVDGPIVLINASRFRCDALILTADDPVRALKLDCDYTELRKRAEAFQTLADTSDASADPPRPDEQRILQDLAWLWQHVTKPVLADLELLSSSPRPAEDVPRIWWCPIGFATFLPLHAAGHHTGTDPGTPCAVMDHAVSSYTSTVSALMLHRNRRTKETQPSTSQGGEVELLAVEMSRTPGARPLPGARAETRRLAELVPNVTRLAGPQATRDAVLGALPSHRFAHFACHALTDPISPALNRLLLHDHLSTPLIAIELSALNVPDAELAYLSACATARSNEKLADEAVHIATAFQLAGYHHVVGTLWPVADNAAGRIADDFYTSLAPSLNADHTARALHRAVCSLRADAPTKPSHWAAHIHLGY
jgi:CHAT domain